MELLLQILDFFFEPLNTLFLCVVPTVRGAVRDAASTNVSGGDGSSIGSYVSRRALTLAGMSAEEREAALAQEQRAGTMAASIPCHHSRPLFCQAARSGV